MKTSLPLIAYGLASRALSPVLPLWLNRRVKHGKEDKTRLGERYGRTKLARPQTRLVWMHGASVGETMMLLPLIERFLQMDKNLTILVTSGTLTSARLLEDKLPKRAFHQFLPADTPTAINRFFNHWQPDLGVFVESDIWPNLILTAHKSNIPLALINARMSEKSLAKWQKYKGTAQTLLGGFKLILAADKQTAQGLGQILGKEIELSGNLKQALPPPAFNKTVLKAYKNALADRLIWCAASTHKGEDEIILTAHQHLQKQQKNPFLILAPRHIERKDEIIALIKQAGFSYILSSSKKPPKQEVDILLMDEMGKMGLVYALSDIAFIGGSLLAGLKGHNPLEPAWLDCAILTGPYYESFADTYNSLISDNGVLQTSKEKLADDIIQLMQKQAKRKALSKAANNYAKSKTAVLDIVVDRLSPLLLESGS